MADNHKDQSHAQTAGDGASKEKSADALISCSELLGTAEGRAKMQPGRKVACSLPDMAIEPSRATHAVAAELRNTTLFGLKSWVYPEKVIGALRAAHPTNAGKFESAYTKFQGGNLRGELRTQLSPPDYRTAIAVLENREGEKKTAEGVETALSRDLLHFKFGADAEATLKFLRQIKPYERKEFEANFPARVGEGHNLRSELLERLGKGDSYRTAIAILENREAEKRNADNLYSALTRTKWFGLRSDPDTMGIATTLASMEPKQLNQFEHNFPKNVGDDLTLRGELRKYLDDDDEYKQAIAMLGELKDLRTDDQQPNGQPAPGKPQGQSSIREWLAAFSKMNQSLGIRGIADIDPHKMDEKEFKAAYARETLHVGAQRGFTPSQVKDIVSSMYAVEGGGWGTSFTTASMPRELLQADKEKERLDFHPSTTAVGYNQVLKASTVDVVTRHGAQIAQRLSELSGTAPAGSAHAKELAAKAQMMGTITAMLNDQHGAPKGLSKEEFARAVHALNMDKDVGPLIQSQVLGDLLDWYKKRKEPSSGQNVAEMLRGTVARLNAQATAYDHLPPHQKTAAINKIVGLAQPAQQDHAAAVQLMDKLKALAKPGLADRLDLSDSQRHLLSVAAKRGENLAPHDPVRMLLNKIHGLYMGHLTVEKLTPAAIELANLAGSGRAHQMLQHPTEPTYKFFSADALKVNSIARNKDAEKLLLDIYATIQVNKRQRYVGNIELNNAFDRARREDS
ncbi:MAG TPA: hypothetical protein V6D22_02620 [Candidatus Obscuribacterales bacterium]